MTAHERVEQSRRDQFYEGVRSVLFELIPLWLKVAVLLALASVLCGWELLIAAIKKLL